MNKGAIISTVFFCSVSFCTFSFATTTFVPITLTQPFSACTLNVSDYAPYKGTDISDNYSQFNDPFAFFTNQQYPGVTLPGPDRAKKCNWVKNENFTWNATNEQCILNGTYGYFQGSQCSTGGNIPSSLTSWFDAAQKGATVDVKLTLPDGTSQDVKVMLGFGHGVLNSHCGDVTLVKQGDHYVAVLQVGTRAWSYEISQPANTYLDPSNVGGTCFIPEVTPLSLDQANSLLEAAMAK